jgi:hypothetical protein
MIGMIFLTAAAAVWGTIKFAIPNLKDSLVNIVTRLTSIEATLSNAIPRAEFDQEIQKINQSRHQHRLTCQGSLQARIEELSGNLKEFDGKRERARAEAVSRADFEAYKKSVKSDMGVLFKKMDTGQELLARLDERIQIFIKSNGA